jgi:thiol:disulfide interchange protein
VAGWFLYRPGPTIELAEEAAWSTEWNDAVRRSRETNRPALVLFTADWCPACRWFESNALVQPGVRGYMESRFTPIMVDLSRPDTPNQSLARQYNIRGFPTLVMYDRAGREVARTHALPADQLLAWLRSDGRKLQ